MWPFRKKFNHNPEDFQLKVVEVWYSKTRIAFKYSANGGKSWKYIHHANPPFLDLIHYDWEWEVLTFNLGDGDFSSEKEKFSSYQKILDYEEKESEKYRKGQEDILNQRKIAEEKRLESFKRANS